MCKNTANCSIYLLAETRFRCLRWNSTRSVLKRFRSRNNVLINAWIIFGNQMIKANVMEIVNTFLLLRSSTQSSVQFDCGNFRYKEDILMTVAESIYTHTYACKYCIRTYHSGSALIGTTGVVASLCCCGTHFNNVFASVLGAA